MQPFATEFPIKPSDNKAAFAAEVFAWLRGMRDSEVLASTSEHELDGENVHLVAETGEELRMRELSSGSEWIAIGFQHDMPDNQGRLWRTEAVLRRSGEKTDHSVVRFKTQCLAKQAGAFLETPRKPFLIKGLLKAGWGGRDAEIDVSDGPRWLADNDDDFGLAEMIVSGKATRRLPVVYISATGWDECVLSPDQIAKLGYDLGGVAHVVVEPNRNFSLRLKDATKGGNVYNGTIAIALPDRGFIRRFYLGRHIEHGSDLVDAVRAAATHLRGFMPADGWDWTELQEHALRAQRAASRGALSQDNADQLLDDFTRQLDELQEENRRLTKQVNALAVSDIAKEERTAVLGGNVLAVVKELYPGEVTDRIRLAAQTALSTAEANGVDTRTVAIWNRILERVPRSHGVDELLAELSRVTKDPKRMANDLANLLQRHGFRGKSDNKHIRLEAEDGFDGLQSITISKTPSDVRSLKNQRKQIERNLGINKLPGDLRVDV